MPNTNAKIQLVDKAITMCSPSNSSALAIRLRVSRQLVSKWRTGESPMADERVTEIARIARVDPLPWLAAIRAEESGGETQRAWREAAKRLGWAACLMLMLGGGSARAAELTQAGLSELRIMYRKFCRSVSVFALA